MARITAGINPRVPMEIKRRVYNKVAHYESVSIPEEFIRNSTLEQQVEEYSNSLAARIVMFFAEKTHKNVERSSRVVSKLNVPTTAWEHLKHQYAPKWFITKFPVKYNVVETIINHESTVTITNLCPHLKSDPTKNHIEFLGMASL